jgi:hypothetical protein
VASEPFGLSPEGKAVAAEVFRATREVFGVVSEAFGMTADSSAVSA